MDSWPENNQYENPGTTSLVQLMSCFGTYIPYLWQEPMNEGRLKCILSGLSRYELTVLEKRFIEAAKHCLEEQGGLTEEQESM